MCERERERKREREREREEGMAVRAESEEKRRGAALVKVTTSHTMFLIAELFEARARAPPLQEAASIPSSQEVRR